MTLLAYWCEKIINYDEIQNDSIPVNCCTGSRFFFLCEWVCVWGWRRSKQRRLQPHATVLSRICAWQFEILRFHITALLSVRSRLRGLKIDAPKSSNCGINLAEFSTRTIIIKNRNQSINQSIDRSIGRGTCFYIIKPTASRQEGPFQNQNMNCKEHFLPELELATGQVREALQAILYTILLWVHLYYTNKDNIFTALYIVLYIVSHRYTIHHKLTDTIAVIQQQQQQQQQQTAFVHRDRSLHGM